ncbi:hypothetical protein CPB97_003936, partial [Podila verticillata]
MSATRRRYKQQWWVRMQLAMELAEQDMASDLSDSSDSDSDSSESENDDDDIADLMEEMVLAESCRYLQRPGMYRKQIVNNLE